jgi:hypothetical protein
MNDPSVSATSVTRLFTFGYGQTCPFTGKDLADHYALVTAPDRSSALRTMLATFGRNWAFEYEPESPTIADYIPRMTLHAQLVIGLTAADPTGLAYTRADDEPDDPTPVSPARVPLHTGGMTDGGLVDETATPGAIDQDAEDAAAFDRGFMREHRRLDRVTGVPLCEHNDDAEACQLTHRTPSES